MVVSTRTRSRATADNVAPAMVAPVKLVAPKPSRATLGDITNETVVDNVEVIVPAKAVKAVKKAAPKTTKAKVEEVKGDAAVPTRTHIRFGEKGEETVSVMPTPLPAELARREPEEDADSDSDLDSLTFEASEYEEDEPAEEPSHWKPGFKAAEFEGQHHRFPENVDANCVDSLVIDMGSIKIKH